MTIVRKEWHRTNESQKAKIKSCKRVSGRGSIDGKKTRKSSKTIRSKKNREASTNCRKFEKERKNGRTKKHQGGARET